MKLLKLRINNFLSFREANLNLSKTGLVAVEGKNLDNTGADSNGSGKSSLFMAIRWCLYGYTDKKLAADEIVNTTAKKNCWVETIWHDELTNIQYRITRYRKDSKHKNRLTLEQKCPEDAKWQQKTLGKNDLTQKSVIKVMGMDDTVFMASCFASQEAAIDIPGMSDKELKQLLEDSLPLAKLGPLHDKYKKILDDLKKQDEKLNSQLDRMSNELKLQIDNLTKAEKDQAEFELDRDHARKKSYVILEKLRTEIDVLGKHLDEHQLRMALDRLRTAYRETKVSEESNLRASLNDAVATLKRLKLMLSDEERCPTCKQIMESAKKADLHAKIDANIKAEQDRHDFLKQKLDECLAKKPLAEKILEKMTSIQNMLAEIKAKEAHRQNLLEQVKREKENFEKLSSNPFDNFVSLSKESIQKLEGDIKKLQAEKEKLYPEIALYESLVETFSPKGFRYHLLESITPELNKATNYYLSILTDGKISAIWSTVRKLASGDFKEEFSIQARMNGRINFGALSGGQKRKVRLACWFALQDIIAQRAEKDVKLWVCDEVDGALDRSGIERLMSLLEEKTRTKESVLVISHNNMRDWIANAITVTMKDDESKVSGFLDG